MDGWGERLRSRARDLGLTDVEVARRLGLAQGRYSAYVNESREPDLGLFVRICQALGTTPDNILGVSSSPAPEDAAMSEVLASLRLLDSDGLTLVSALVRTVAAHRTHLVAKGDVSEPRQSSRGDSSEPSGE